MNKKVAIFTGTRAEYGLLSQIIGKVAKDSELILQLWVGGMHLLEKFGYTKQQIVEDGFEIAAELDFLLPEDNPVAVTTSMGKAVIQAGEAFAKLKPDVMILLGDRFETFAIAQAALIANVPVAHIHGGEITEAAMDDAIRHAITKLSHVHFTANETYRQRVIQLGEQPDRVFNVGAPGIDNIMHLPLLSQKQLSEELGLNDNKPYFLITYHPETLSGDSGIDSLNALIEALDDYRSHDLFITYPNADTYGQALIDRLEKLRAEQPERVHLFQSVGQLKYLSAMKYCQAVIGNSSSGIIEAPSFHVPTVNIGDRQKGRMASQTVIHCREDKPAITAALEKATSDRFLNDIQCFDNPYGDGHSCQKIIDLLKVNIPKSVIKTFYNIER